MYSNKIFALTILLLYNIVCAQKSTTVVIFSKTEGYRHQSIEAGIASIKKLGEENHFLVIATENADELISYVKKCEVVVFLNTTENIFNEEQQKVFKKFITNGGGFVGIHSATDTEYDWPWYGKMIGAYFESHTDKQEATINIVNIQHAATNFLSSHWKKFDEWYNFKNISSHINVLMTLDETTYSGGLNGENHPISWFHEFEGGRIFYTGLGHTKESYSDEMFLKHILGGIFYAMGKKKN